MLATLPRDFWTMMLAGFFNAVAFLALAKSLQLIPVVYVNALSSSQAAMAAVAGILIFAERSSPALWLGVRADHRRTAHDAAEIDPQELCHRRRERWRLNRPVQ